MQFISRRFLTRGLIASGLTGSAYYVNSELTPDPSIFDESKLTPRFQNYIKENDLKVSFFRNMYQRTSIFKNFFEGHIITDVQGLDYYNVYIQKSLQEALKEDSDQSTPEIEEKRHHAKLYCIFKPNKHVQDSFGTVHPGFVFTLFDTIGAYTTCLAKDFIPPLTAYLNIENLQPIEIGKEYMAISEVVKIERKKIFVKAKICDEEGNVYCSMDSLYLQSKFNNVLIKEFVKLWFGFRQEQLFGKSSKEKNYPQIQN